MLLFKSTSLSVYLNKPLEFPLEILRFDRMYIPTEMHFPSIFRLLFYNLASSVRTKQTNKQRRPTRLAISFFLPRFYHSPSRKKKGRGESGFLVERCIGEVVGDGRSLLIGGAVAGNAHSAAARTCITTMRHVTLPRAFSSSLQENTRAGRDHRRYRPRQCKVASLVNISRRLRPPSRHFHPIFSVLRRIRTFPIFLLLYRVHRNIRTNSYISFEEK